MLPALRPMYHSFHFLACVHIVGRAPGAEGVTRSSPAGLSNDKAKVWQQSLNHPSLRFAVTCCSTGGEACTLLGAKDFDIVLVEVRLLRSCPRCCPRRPVSRSGALAQPQGLRVSGSFGVTCCAYKPGPFESSAIISELDHCPAFDLP